MPDGRRTSTANLFDLAGQRILITGAAGGIGDAAARACAQMGADLVLADIRSTEPLRDELRETGVAVESYVASTAARDEIEAVVARCRPLTAAVDCAGFYPTGDWLTDPEWDVALQRVMEVNLFGPLHLARAVMPGMIERGGGRIVLIGSVAGRSGGASASTQPHYVSAKGGVHSLIRWLARRGVRHNVLVNGIAPGPVDTAINAGATHNLDDFPMRRMGKPEEIAWPIAFLCSPASAYMSGAVMDINGGTFVG